MNSVPNRAQKIDSISAMLLLIEPANFNVQVNYSGLQGPHIVVKTPQYEGTVTVDFKGTIVRYDMYGFRQRFADPSAFHNFFLRTLEAPTPACLSLAKALNGKTAGSIVIASLKKVPYVFTEQKNGMFEVNFNNQKTTMSLDDILLIFQPA